MRGCVITVMSRRPWVSYGFDFGGHSVMHWNCYLTHIWLKEYKTVVLFNDGGLGVRCIEESCLSAHQKSRVESCLGSELMAAVFFGSFLLWLLSLLSAQWGMLSVVRISLWKLEFLGSISLGVSRPSNSARAWFPMAKEVCPSSIDQFINGWKLSYSSSQLPVLEKPNISGKLFSFFFFRLQNLILQWMFPNALRRPQTVVKYHTKHKKNIEKPTK